MRSARRMGGGALFTLVAAIAASCADSPTEVVFEVIEDVEFDASLNVDLAQMTELPSGVYIQELMVGTGAEIAAGDSAVVNYTLWLRTGLEVDARQYGYKYGANPREVIDGFELGMAGQLVGETRLIIIPPGLAYGAGAVGVIPPGSILVYQVELLSLS